MSFVFKALGAKQFEHYFGLNENTLSAQKASMHVCDEINSFPCRVSMQDAGLGERVLLLNFEHQPGHSEYQSSHAIFVREGVEQAVLQPGMVPECVLSRYMSLRGFDAEHRIVDAILVEGEQLAETVDTIFGEKAVEYIHAHYAQRGCFAAQIDRA